MKTTITIFIFCCLCLCATYIKAQIPQTVANGAVQSQLKTKLPENYTYKIYKAPNGTYGYDIFKNNKGVFHQPAKANPKDIAGFLQQEVTEKAANLSIEKLKKNMLPKLSPQEIKKLLNN
jgi:hypothetical protein